MKRLFSCCFRMSIFALLISLSSAVGAQGRLIALIPLDHALSVTVNPLTGLLYSGTRESIAVFDMATHSLVTSIPVTSTPSRLAINIFTNQLYAVDQIAAEIVVVDGQTQSISGTIPLAGLPYGIALNPTTNRIYVTNLLDGVIAVIDGETHTLLDTIVIGHQLSEIAVNSTTNLIYVSDDVLSAILVIDGVSHSTLTSIILDTIDPLVPQNPNRIVINEFTNHIVLSVPIPDTHLSDLIQIDGATNTIVHTLPLADTMNSIAINPSINHIYAATANADDPDGKTYIIDADTNMIVDQIPLELTPYDITVNPLTSRVYIVAIIPPGEAEASAMMTVAQTTFAQASTTDRIAVIQDIRPPIPAPRQHYYASSTPTLSWNRLAWAVGYEIVVAVDPNFTSPVYHNDQLLPNQLSVSTTHLTNGLYYWRVRGKRSTGGWGSWSVTEQFVVTSD